MVKPFEDARLRGKGDGDIDGRLVKSKDKGLKKEEILTLKVRSFESEPCS